MNKVTSVLKSKTLHREELSFITNKFNTFTSQSILNSKIRSFKYRYTFRPLTNGLSIGSGTLDTCSGMHLFLFPRNLPFLIPRPLVLSTDLVDPLGLTVLGPGKVSLHLPKRCLSPFPLHLRRLNLTPSGPVQTDLGGLGPSLFLPGASRRSPSRRGVCGGGPSRPETVPLSQVRDTPRWDTHPQVLRWGPLVVSVSAFGRPRLGVWVLDEQRGSGSSSRGRGEVVPSTRVKGVRTSTGVGVLVTREELRVPITRGIGIPITRRCWGSGHGIDV